MSHQRMWVKSGNNSVTTRNAITTLKYKIFTIFILIQSFMIRTGTSIQPAFESVYVWIFYYVGAGVQFSNINQGASVDDSFTMLQVGNTILTCFASYTALSVILEDGNY